MRAGLAFDGYTMSKTSQRWFCAGPNNIRTQRSKVNRVCAIIRPRSQHYDAALTGGCEIVERHAHSRRLPGSVAALGRDA